jgi:hypothetical protein
MTRFANNTRLQGRSVASVGHPDANNLRRTRRRGRAPQRSRSIRIHRNARCEPRRCAAASCVSVSCRATCPKNMILAKKNNQSELHHILPPKARLNFPEANLDTHDSDADETAVVLRDDSLADLTLRLLMGREKRCLMKIATRLPNLSGLEESPGVQRPVSCRPKA